MAGELDQPAAEELRQCRDDVRLVAVIHNYFGGQGLQIGATGVELDDPGSAPGTIDCEGLVAAAHSTRPCVGSGRGWSVDDRPLVLEIPRAPGGCEA